jgi:cobalt-zinc-cadmium efflux system membrane fusion protein
MHKLKAMMNIFNRTTRFLLSGSGPWQSNPASTFWSITSQPTANHAIRILRNFVALMAILTAVSCSNRTIQEDPVNYMVTGDTVFIPEHSNIRTRLKHEEVVTEAYRLELITAGIVRTIPNRYAEIAPPFSGRVLKSFVRLGQKVEPGSPIFELSSPDFFNAQKEYFDARQEFRQAELNLKRQQDLLKNGVGIQRELEEAETDFATKRSSFDNAAAALKIFSINPEEVVLGQPLTVTSPIRGEIVDNRIVIGQYLKEDAAPIAMVAELSTVWVAGQVKEKDIRLIKELDAVEIRTDAYRDKLFPGRVYHVNSMVDEDTRSVQVLIECDNTERDLKPGMYVTVRFTETPEPAVLIPGKAVMLMNEDQYVFVQVGKDQYQRRKIETEGTSNGKVVVRSGLHAGEIILSEGGIYLMEAR